MLVPGSQHSFLVWQPNILWGQLYFEKWLSWGQPLFEAIFTALPPLKKTVCFDAATTRLCILASSVVKTVHHKCTDIHIKIHNHVSSPTSKCTKLQLSIGALGLGCRSKCTVLWCFVAGGNLQYRVLYRGGCRILKGRGPTDKVSQKGGPALGPVLKSLHHAPMGGGGPDPTGACFNTHDGLSDRASAHSTMDK